MLLNFVLAYLVPIAVINAAVFILLKLFKPKYLTHFYIYLFVEVMYLVSNWINLLHPSFYNHYVHLADAILHGRLYLNFNPPYHDVSFYHNHVYISQPPLPALLMLPFVLIYGANFNDIIFTIVLGAINCAILYQILLMLNKNSIRLVVTKKVALFLTLFFAFGTVMWSVTVRGTVWHTAHVVVLLFLLLAIYEALGKRRFFLIGLWASTAIAARPSVYWAFPFFILLLINDYLIKKEYRQFFLQLIFFLIPYFVWAILLGLLNYVRFGNFLEFGFAYMNHAGQLKYNLETYGTLNPFYLKDNLNIAFIKFFKFVNKPPYLIPKPEGLSMFITSPLLIYMFKAFSKDSLKSLIRLDVKNFFQSEIINLGAIAAAVCTAIPLLLYFNSGWVQFGYRYILDYIPFLIILMAHGMKNKISVLAVILWAVSIIMNLYGMIIYMHFSGIIW